LELQDLHMIKQLRNLFIVGLVIYAFGAAWSQNMVLDSLKNELSGHIGDEKVEVLLNIANELNPTQLELSIKYTNEALAISKTTNNRQNIAKCQLYLGNFQYHLGNYQKAQHFFKLAFHYATIEDDEEMYCQVMQELGILYSVEGMLDSAKYYFNDALKYSKSLHDTTWEISTLRLLGNVHYKLGQFDDALSYYHKALGLASYYGRAKDEEGKLCNNIGILLSDWKKYHKSLSYYHRALQIMKDADNELEISRIYNNMGTVYWYLQNSDSALLFYNKSLKYKIKSGDINGKAYVLNNLGMYYGEAEEYPRAIEYFNQALNSFEDLSNRMGITMTLYNIGSVYQAKNNYQLAIKYFSQSLNIAQSQHFSDYILENYEALENTYAASNQWEKAYNALYKYDRFSDSLDKAQNIELVSEMEVKFDNEKHQATLNILKNQMKTSEIKKNQIKIFIIGVIVILILVIATTYFFIRQIQMQTELKENELTPALLRYQMNPKFINSSLIGIKELISKNRKAESSMFLSGFAKLIRTFIETSTYSAIVLDDEIETIRKFLKLHQLRYEHKLTYELNIAPQIETEMLAVPPFLFFPVFVLAIGYRLDKGPVNAIIDIDTQNNYLIIHTKLSYSIKSYNKEADRLDITTSIETIQTRVDMLNYSLKDKISFKYWDETKNDGQLKVLILDGRIPIKPV